MNHNNQPLHIRKRIDRFNMLAKDVNRLRTLILGDLLGITQMIARKTNGTGLNANEIRAVHIRKQQRDNEKQNLKKTINRSATLTNGQKRKLHKMINTMTL